MSKEKTFKSSRPHKYYSAEEYISILGGKAQFIGKMENGHRYGETCKNCGNPYGSHGSDNRCLLPKKTC